MLTLLNQHLAFKKNCVQQELDVTPHEKLQDLFFLKGSKALRPTNKNQTCLHKPTKNCLWKQIITLKTVDLLLYHCEKNRTGIFFQPCLTLLVRKSNMLHALNIILAKTHKVQLVWPDFSQVWMQKWCQCLWLCFLPAIFSFLHKSCCHIVTAESANSVPLK